MTDVDTNALYVAELRDKLRLATEGRDAAKLREAARIMDDMPPSLNEWTRNELHDLYAEAFRATGALA